MLHHGSGNCFVPLCTISRPPTLRFNDMARYSTVQTFSNEESSSGSLYSIVFPHIDIFVNKICSLLNILEFAKDVVSVIAGLGPRSITSLEGPPFSNSPRLYCSYESLSPDKELNVGS
eukprot:scaffold11014_cov144-Skeletonema_marinoi.AAC.1